MVAIPAMLVLCVFVGSVCVLLLLLSAAMYYENLFSGLLPVVQKASLVMCLGWLVAVHYTTFDQEGRECIAPNKTIEPAR
jgi:glucan phosphoethanolaminetransferase (alkaline phosphatase superfamily)